MATEPLYSPAGFWTDSVASSSGTRAAPSLVTEGTSLVGAFGFRVIISAVSGQTLSGVGKVRLWVWDTDLARWCLDPQLEFDVTASGKTWTNVRDLSSPDFEVTVPYGRVCPQVVSVGTSSGEPVTQVRSWSK